MTDLSTPYFPKPTPAEVGLLSEPKSCGECSLCCKLLDIAELEKPMHVWCRHFAKGVGCGIYAERPGVCRDYQCSWTLAGPLDERWRPDNAGFLIHPGPIASEVEIVVDPSRPDAWRREPFYSQIKHWSNRANVTITRVLVRTRGRVIVVFPEEEIDLGLPDGKPGIHSGYEMKDGKLQPFARFAYSADDPPA